MISFKGRHFQQEMTLQSIRWYLAYSLSYRDIEEIMMERGFVVDHSSIQQAHQDSPRVAAACEEIERAREKSARIVYAEGEEFKYYKLASRW